MVIYAMLDEDTICAVSTPVGEGGIGIVRISGKRSLLIAGSLFRSRSGRSIEEVPSHTVHYGLLHDPSTGEVIDEVLVNVMRSPKTYTREDVVEINCHGGMIPLRRTTELLIAAGARQAEPGEFTKRAFLNGRIDLVQAEAVMDVIRARTERSLQAANEQLRGGLSAKIRQLRERLIGVIAGVEAGVDFPEEEIETPTGDPLEKELQLLAEEVQRLLDDVFYGRVMREGLATAIAGRPNVGKSSLLNALLCQDRAIVTEVPGTTRDVLEEQLNIRGTLIRIVDTAGIRHSSDIVEQEGVRRSIASIETADIVLIVLDGSLPLTDEDRLVLDAAKGRPAIAVINKGDLPRKVEQMSWPEKQVRISCRTGEGLDELKGVLISMMESGMVLSREHGWAVNQRHRIALERTKQSLEQAFQSVRSMLSPEFIAIDLRDALDHLGVIIGATHTEDILEKIFQEFCIGK
jgi:tRNA modification GTPase